jgi:hypothetical protein
VREEWKKLRNRNLLHRCVPLIFVLCFFFCRLPKNVWFSVNCYFEKIGHGQVQLFLWGDWSNSTLLWEDWSNSTFTLTRLAKFNLTSKRLVKFNFVEKIHGQVWLLPWED